MSPIEGDLNYRKLSLLSMGCSGAGRAVLFDTDSAKTKPVVY